MTGSTIAFDLGRVRDLAGRSWHPWGRRLILLAMLAFVLVGLAGAFGQVQRKRVTDGPVAKLTVRTPEALRGGLYWPAEIRVEAHRRITAPVLLLGASGAPIGWAGRDQPVRKSSRTMTIPRSPRRM